MKRWSTFKGTVSRAEYKYFLKVLKAEQNYFKRTQFLSVVFTRKSKRKFLLAFKRTQFLSVVFTRKSKRKFLLASMKSLTNCNNPPVTQLLQLLCSGDFDHENAYRNPPLVWNIITEATYIGHVQLPGFFQHTMRGGHWRKSTNDGDKCRYRNNF